MKYYGNGPLGKWVLKFLYHTRIFEASFYLKAFGWKLKNRHPKVDNIQDVFHYFFEEFLEVPPDGFRITKKSEKSMTVESWHDCPILKMAEIIEMDTRKVCLRTSKGPCQYFIRNLGKNIRVENDYYNIRPHEEKCTETLSIVS